MAARSEAAALMRPFKTLLLAAALAAAGAGAASAELALESIHWQAASRVEGGRVTAWRFVRTLTDPPKPADRMRALLALKNDGPQNEEGLLLRYSLTGRVLPDGGVEGVWAVPFVVDEKRVPKVGAGKTIEVPLDAGAALELYVRRMTRAGWRIDRVRVQVMLEPHRGSKVLQAVEDVLEIGRGAGRP